MSTTVLFLHPFLMNNTAHSGGGMDAQLLFRLLEVPFLLFVIILAFLVAKNLRGGRFGSGMNYIAWGFLVMAVGHVHMQIDHQFGVNVFNSVLGETIGMLAWFLALILTWTLSAIGFYKLYKASKS